MNDVSRPRDSRDDKEKQRESGEPGGGKGRKDEVGRSGVYPMSGPHPAGEAEIKQQAAWGQGERGAAGYEDHGGSELTFEGGELLGELNAGPGGEPLPEPPQAAGDLDVPHDRWSSFLDSFSRQHEDWLVNIEVKNLSGALVVAEQRRFQAVNLERAEEKERASILVGHLPEERLVHIVENPAQMRFKRSQTGAHEGLEITSSDGTTTVIRFRAAMVPEMLDGIAA